MLPCNKCGRLFKKRGMAPHQRHCNAEQTIVASSVQEQQSTTLASLPELPDKKCNKCNSEFKTIQAVKSHEKFCKGKVELHSQPQPRRLSTTLPVNCDNICDVCGDSFSTPTSLKVHKLTHRKKAM